ncbi:MAG: hypothetical protein F4090_02855 [Nitrospira sp. SB0672_bin_25]|nr:hypothetical protein [Nitrospira sp. SB0666_bin_27]MYF25400.1 hypothetical protein [Nitrospira sp. SB0678_bin_10]MYJ53842.1 hypothetical protein [Nitrospira sp. SB0672_bin_25]
MLQTVSKGSLRTSHPAHVSVETFEKILTGIHYRRSPARWLQRLMDSGTKSSPLLAPEQVAFWAPRLRRAFLQVTAEEQVFMRIPLPSTPEIQNLTGMLSFEQNDLHMALSLSGFSGQRPHSKTKPRNSEALGVTRPTIVFLPKTAIKTSWDEETVTNLTIDIASLAMPDGSGLEDSSARPSPPDDAPRLIAPKVIPQATPPQRLDPSPASVSKDSAKTPSKPDVATPRVAPPVIPPDRPIIRLEAPPSEALMKEIRSLRRELSRQKQEIERLKKQRKSP